MCLRRAQLSQMDELRKKNSGPKQDKTKIREGKLRTLSILSIVIIVAALYKKNRKLYRASFPHRK